MTICFVAAGPLARTSFTTAPTTNTSLQHARAHARVSRSTRVPLMVAAPERSSTIAAGDTDVLSILLPEKLSQEGIDLLSGQFSVVKKFDLTPEQLIEEIPNHEAIIIRSATKMTAAVIAAATKLKVIGRAGVGVDNIDIPAATKSGVLVVNAPTGNCIAAAEHSIALLTSMSRLISAADATIKAGSWNRSSFVGASLVEKVLGVVGLGRIGREVAKRARGLGMKVVASDPFTSEEAAAAIGVTLTSMDDVLAQADFLTLHIPLIPSTKNLIDADAIAKMKQGARIINAARGGIVNEEALFAALQAGKIAAAALDCFEFEPPFKHPDSISAKLVMLPNVLATPHLGASTREAQEDVAVEIATVVRDSLKGDMVPTMINAPAFAPEILKLLKPRAVLCARLGRLAYEMSGSELNGDIKIEYYIPDGSEDTRILRAGLIKGLMEQALGIQVSIVNADLVAKNAGLRLTEVNHFAMNGEGSEVVLTSKSGLVVHGRVSQGKPHVTRIGPFVLDMSLGGVMMMYSQDDRPGQLGRIGTLLGEQGINISYMALGRDSSTEKALVLLRLDSRPSDSLVKRIDEIIDDSQLRPVVVEF